MIFPKAKGFLVVDVDTLRVVENVVHCFGRSGRQTCYIWNKRTMSIEVIKGSFKFIVDLSWSRKMSCVCALCGGPISSPIHPEYVSTPWGHATHHLCGKKYVSAMKERGEFPPNLSLDGRVEF